MRIRGVNFPESLLAAQREGRLIVFAGAGVSMGEPSNFPSFAELTERIASWAGVARQDKEPYVRFLGRLVHEGKRVHDQAVRILTNPDSAPTTLHENILSLFGESSAVRLVTTNFDAHFETAWDNKEKASVQVFRAPALPLGNDFTGIVYVHGSVRADPKWIVLTDQDFGRAYLTEGWASRFLRSMFEGYAVLFIGYSHDDEVMHYLSRGLPPEGTQPRFALVPETSNLEYWRYLGIQPVTYARDDKNGHSLLIDGLSGWVEWARRGALDTEKRIRELVEGPPPLDGESIDLLEWSLKDSVAVRFFVRYAVLPEWLEWVSGKDVLGPLFDTGDLSPTSKELLQWVCSRYVLRHPDDVLTLIQHNGKLLHPWFTFEITRRLAYEEPKPAEEILSKWIPILIQNSSPLDRYDLAQVLSRTLSTGATSAFVQLFGFVTAPRLELKKPLVWPDEENGASRKVDAELGFRGDYHRPQEIWAKKIKPNLEAYAHHLWPVVLSNLQATYLLLKSWRKASIKGDPVSWHRSAIEPHEQDQFQQAEDLLISAARDCLEWALKNQPSLADAWIETISAMEPQIMRRLAVHGMTENTVQSGNAKIGWLIAKNFLVAPGLKHEVFRLLQVAYPAADAQFRQRLIDTYMVEIDALPTTEEDDPERKDYQKFNLLIWLSEATPDCELVKQRLEKIRKANPTFQTREHPDLSHWTGNAEFVGPRTPVTAEELLSKHPSEWFEYLLEFKGDRFMGPDRDGLLYALGEAVQQNANWGFDLVEILSNQNHWTSDMWSSVIRGWGRSTLTSPDWNKILKILNRDQLTQGFTHEISDLLQDGTKKEEGGIPLELFAGASEIAGKVWGQLPIKEEFEEENWLGKAINRPAGKLAFFWLFALSKTCKEKGTCSDGIPKPYRERFTEIVTSQTAPAIFGRVILVSQLGFLYALDPGWSRDNLVPLLDWETDSDRAQQVWDGWLSWGKWSDPLLQQILPFYRQAFSRLPSKLASEQHRFIEHILAIAVYWTKDPMRDGFIPEFLRTVSEEQRVSFASQMHSFLMNMKEETKAELWSRWLRDYLVGRNDGVPVPYSEKEQAETMEWLGDLEIVFDEAVEVTCSGPVPHFEHTLLFHQMKETKIPEGHPEATARLLVHVTSDPEMLRYHCRDLEEITTRAIAAGASTRVLNQLCDRLAKVGCPEAAKLQESIRGRG